jgi:TetR/AcrR family transcriptional regulator, transcriptional repressor for nem operon
MAETCKIPMLAAGEELFLRRGFAAVGLRELLDAVGVSKGAFYHFFASKEIFAAAVLERHATARGGQISAALAGGNVLAAVLDWLRADLEAQQAADWVPRCLASRLAADLGAGMPAGPVAAALADYQERLAEGLARGQAAGAIYGGFAAEAAAGHLLDLWRGAGARAALERSERAPRAALEHFAAWLKP